MMPSESEQFLGLSARQPQPPTSPVIRTIITVLFICFILFGIAVLSYPLIMFFAYAQAMTAFGLGVGSGQSQAPRIVQLIGFIVIGALPLAIYLFRRAFSRRHK